MECSSRPEAGGGIFWAGTIAYAEAGTSTMDLARQTVGAAHGHSWRLGRQTAGRGRRGRPWASADHAGVWMTTLLRVPARQDLPCLALVAGCSVLEVVGEAGVVGAGIKWPNDIWVAGRKLAGVLIEVDGGAVAGRAQEVRVGVGINVGAPPDDLAAVGLTQLLAAAPPCGEPALCGRLAAALADRLRVDVARWLAAGLAPFAVTLARHDILAGSDVEVSPAGGAPWRGRAAGIDPHGRLRVLTAGGPRWVVAGEVSRLRPGGAARGCQPPP